jgi:hypothetical protein
LWPTLQAFTLSLERPCAHMSRGSRGNDRRLWQAAASRGDAFIRGEKERLSGGAGWLLKFKNENQICNEFDSLQALASKLWKFGRNSLVLAYEPRNNYDLARFHTFELKFWKVKGC